MALNIIRFLLILLTISVSALYIVPFTVHAQTQGADSHFMLALGLFAFFMVAALLTILIDIRTKSKQLSSLGGVFIGLIAGLIVAYALSFVVDLSVLFIGGEPQFDPPPRTVTLNNEIYIEEYRKAWNAYEDSLREMPENAPKPDFQPPPRVISNPDYIEAEREYEAALIRRQTMLDLLQGVKVLIGLITCYLGISLVMQTKDDFRFVIPYVEFAKEVRGSRPTLVDTSVVIDGRIVDIIDTRVIQGSLIVPKFVLQELQLIADSSDKLKRERGRRGLDILQKLQDNHIVEVRIEDAEAEGGNVDQKLVSLAQQLQARVMTNDYNLNKIATLRGVDVININDLAKSLRPVVLPGEEMNVKIIKPGESPTQGVGYLDDGTMVVVENARAYIGENVDMVVTSTLQTSAGRMIFGKVETNGNAASVTDSAASPGGSHATTNVPPTTGETPKKGSPAPHGETKPRPGGHPSARNPRRSQ